MNSSTVIFGIITVVALIIVGVIHSVITGQVESANEELMQIQRQGAQINQKISEVDLTQKTQMEALKFYEAYITKPDSDPKYFTKDYARTSILEMRKKFGLSSLELSMSSFNELSVPEATPSSLILNSTGKIKVGSAYDVPVYQFIAAIEDSLPGRIFLTSVTLKKQGNVDAAGLAELTSGQGQVYIEAEIQFEWFGVVDPNFKRSDLNVIANVPLEVQDAVQEINKGADALINNASPVAIPPAANPAAPSIVPNPTVQNPALMRGSDD